MRVAFTCILRDDDPEHTKIGAMLDSAKSVGFTDLIAAIDSRCPAGTTEWVSDRWGPSHDVFEYEWRDDFAYARNLTLARVPKECEWWGWADGDDTIVSLKGKTIPEFLETVPAEIGGVFFDYDYLHDEFGNRKTTHLKGRLYRGTGFEWRWRLHEDCHPCVKDANGDVIRNLAFQQDVKILRAEDEFEWVHHPDRDHKIDPDRNFRILKLMLEDDPDDTRTWYLIGNQHFAQHNWQLAIDAYERYIAKTGWELEKWAALIYTAIACRALENWEGSIKADTQAMQVMPELADSYFGLGETYTRLGQWERARKFGEIGLARVFDERNPGIPDATVFYNDNAYAFWPYTWLAVCYFNLGDNQKALAAYEKALEVRPEPDLRRTVEHLKWAMDRTRIIHNGIDLAAGLMRRNEPLKALNVLTALPAGSADDPNVVMMRNKIAGMVAHLEDTTKYKNLYFTEEERNDPFDVTDESIANFMPRLVWTLRRMKVNGVKKVLDLGIGDGTPAFYFARHGIQVVGIDVDTRRVKAGNLNAVKAGYQTMQSVAIPREPIFEGCTCVHDEGDHGWSKCKEDGCVCVGHWSDDGPDEHIESPVATPESMAQFLWCQPGEITPQVEALGPFDAVLALELIEHVPDPDALLELCERMAPLVLVSTPDGAYDGPQEINPGHVRLWSQRDLTRLIATRGWMGELHSIPRFAGEQPTLVAEYRTKYPQSDARVIIWCPPTGQNWTPDSIWREGIGGSETAVIRVAEELAKRGKRVTVYAECEGIWGGVRYAYAQDFRPQPCEMFVSWRTIGPSDAMRDLAAHRFVWCHDVHAGDITPEQLEGVTLLALSQWHKDFLQSRYPTANIIVSGNGIDPERFEQKIERIPHRMIYAQSPDRGLDQVLQLFPMIKQRYPDATLEVFYGFEMARKRNPQFIAGIEQLAHQDGVTLHGRVNQDRLAEEYLKADVLLYPAVTPDGSNFMETYCISVVEALAAGCFPITADHGALRETNHGGAFFRPPVYDEALFQLFAFWDRPAKEQHRMRDHGYAGTFERSAPPGGQRWARKQTWGRIADQWCELIVPPKPALVEAAAE